MSSFLKVFLVLIVCTYVSVFGFVHLSAVYMESREGWRDM